MPLSQIRQALRSDWSVRTENPFEANLFLIPAQTCAKSLSCNGFCIPCPACTVALL